MLMLFKIYSISYGWFDVYLSSQFLLTNSDYMGCDAPLLLLEALNDLLEGKNEKSWLCWQDEPGAYILNLEKQKEQLQVTVYNADKDSYDLDYNGAILKQDITTVAFETRGEIMEVAKNILEEFELYENGNGRQRYEYHWGGFPEEQYQRLKKKFKMILV